MVTASKSNDEEWNDWGQQADTLSYYLLEVDHALPFMVIVPGTSDPWLAGLPNGSSASGGDTAPAQSPVLVRSFGVDLGYGLAFDVTGLVDNGPGEGWPPDGVNMQGHDALTENGMSNITAPKDCLLGVFLGADRPDLTPAPAALSFNRNGALNFQTLRPLLKHGSPIRVRTVCLAS